MSYVTLQRGTFPMISTLGKNETTKIQYFVAVFQPLLHLNCLWPVSEQNLQWPYQPLVSKFFKQEKGTTIFDDFF
jgi:hypothetical protein